MIPERFLTPPGPWNSDESIVKVTVVPLGA